MSKINQGTEYGETGNLTSAQIEALANLADTLRAMDLLASTKPQGRA